ncbi:PDR/VanB family oxidoreductase [Pseudonocardia sp. DSM 110487]|uniref:PDR/VanB family oxidoreductase n=1 Tax=Pseudonocardia sp. DSM 110487 TaxID=2865833 RepID=UPI001C69D3AA|nr:PDR/VanB family oxidoreductase [Pseudonocardia sp. DSM 110487]QYN38746.1 PDR/VanB family oxidoreductase [Pseudonocardia sp. DSM 110487]
MGATSHKRWRRARVLDVCDVAREVKQVVLEPEHLEAPAPPGSHIDIGVYVNGRADVRSYSVVGMGGYGTELILGVQLARQSRGGSAFMHSLRRGREVSVTQPLQNFPLTYGRPGYVLAAGGIGITALVAMGRALRSRGADYRFVYGARSRDLMAFVDDLVAEHGDRMELRIDDEGGSLDVEELVASVPAGGELYVCGPPPMLDAIKAAWARAGRRPAGLRFETFGSSGRFAPESFTVRIPRLGLETIVSHDVSMLEALEACGAEMMYDCRRGECGLCQVKVLEIAGAIDHRDVFLSDAQHAAGDRLQCCVSRLVSPRTAGLADADGRQAAVTIDIP